MIPPGIEKGSVESGAKAVGFELITILQALASPPWFRTLKLAVWAALMVPRLMAPSANESAGAAFGSEFKFESTLAA